jgi:WD40 repeat protein
LEGHTDVPADLAVTPDGELAVSAGHDHSLRIWDLRNGCSAGILQGHADKVLAVRTAPDGRRAVSVSSDRTVRLWDLLTQRRVALCAFGSVISALSPIGEDGRFACGTLDGECFTLRVPPILS